MGNAPSLSAPVDEIVQAATGDTSSTSARVITDTIYYASGCQRKFFHAFGACNPDDAAAAIWGKKKKDVEECEKAAESLRRCLQANADYYKAAKRLKKTRERAMDKDGD